MPFSIKKSYMHKIRKDQEKFIVPNYDETESVTVKNIVDGSVNTVNGATLSKNPPVAGSKMRKTIYTYADR